MRAQPHTNPTRTILGTALAGVEDRSGRARPGRLLAAEDVAEVLGVNPTFVYTLARRGALPTVRVGERYVRFRPEAIESWIQSQESTRPKGTR